MLTIGIPLRKPTTAQLVWARDVVSRLLEEHPALKVVISIHSHTGGVHFGLRNVKVLCTTEEYSFDHNVYIISQAVETRYWMLLAGTDRLQMEKLSFLLQVLGRADLSTAVFFTGAVQAGISSYLMPQRLGFLSSYIFNAPYFREACPSSRDFRGWIHTAIFLKAIKEKRVVIPLSSEFVEEDIEPGFIKPWTARGGFLIYQVSLGRLISSLLPHHPARRAYEAHAIGHWPFDLFKALVKGVNLTTRERRYIGVWRRRQGGLVIIFFRLLKQIQARITSRKH